MSQTSLPTELMSEIRTHFSVSTFVETGTYLGQTARWASAEFTQVITIEAAETLYHQAKDASPHAANIRFLHGDTQDCLAEVVPQLTEASLFWLDAHWSGGPTAGEDSECPLMEELAIINRSPYDHFLFIDDARLFLAPPHPHQISQWPNIATVLSSVNPAGRPRYVTVFADVLIAVPLPAQQAVSSYLQEAATRAGVQPGVGAGASFASAFIRRARRLFSRMRAAS